MTSGPFEPPVFEQPNFRADAQGELEDEEFEEEDEEEGETERAAGTVNRLAGGTARAVLDHIARSLVEEPDAVQIEVAEGRSGLRLSLHVSPSDMGRVIGRRGRVAQAIRGLVRAAAARDGTDATVDIVD